MKSRRKRRKKTSMLGALGLEAATLVAIVAVAQPSALGNLLGSLKNAIHRTALVAEAPESATAPSLPNSKEFQSLTPSFDTNHIAKSGYAPHNNDPTFERSVYR